MGCRSGKPDVSINPVNVDTDVKKKFIAGAYFSKVGAGLEENLQIGFHKHKRNKYEPALKAIEEKQKEQDEVS